MSKDLPDGPHPIDAHVGRRLAQGRLGRRMTQTELGRAVGVTFQQIQKYETGRNRISASTLFRFARHLDLPVTYFFPEEGDVSAPSTPTRESVELGRIAPTLTVQHQRALLNLAKSLASSTGD